MALGATLKVRMDTSEVNRGLRGMKGKISAAFGTIRKVGVAAFGAIAAAGGALAALTVNATKFSTGVHTMATQTGLTVHEILALQNAMKMVGADTDQASSLIVEFKKRLAEARMGTGEAVIGLEALDMTVQDLASMNTLQAFTAVMDGVRGVGAESDKAKLILDKFFGGAGMEHLTVLSSRFAELMAEATDNTESLAGHMKDASQFDAMNMGLAKLSVMLRELQIRFVNALPLDRIKRMMDDVDLQGFGDKLTDEIEKFFKKPQATMAKWAIETGILLGEGIIKGIMQFLTSSEGALLLGKLALTPVRMPFILGGALLEGGKDAATENIPQMDRKNIQFNWPLLENLIDGFKDIQRQAGDFFGISASSEVGDELVRQGNEANILLRRIEGAAPSYA